MTIPHDPRPGVDVAVVGAGPAGCAAAVQCRRFGLRVALFDARGQAGGLIANAFRVENHPGIAPCAGRVVARSLQDFLARWAIPVKRGAVLSLVPGEEGLLLIGSFGELTARSVILAVGTSPVRLELDGAADLEGERLYYEVNDLLDHHPRPARTVVIGGGEAALDYALSLARAGSRVSVLVRGKEPRACRRLHVLVAEESAIQVHTCTRVAALERLSGGLRIMTDTPAGLREYRCEAALAALGRRSVATELLAPPGVKPAAGIGTDRPGLFVAGDARLGSLGQLGIAFGDGLQAARSAASRGLLER